METTDIKKLLSEAGEAGDWTTVALCRLALGWEWNPGWSDEIAIETSRELLALGIVPEHVGSDDRARSYLTRTTEYDRMANL